MPREHWNDVPGDIAGGEAEDLPGGFGVYNPDLNPDAMVDDVVESDVISPTGSRFSATDQHGGDTAGTGYAEGTNTGSTIDPAELLEGEEAHPGAAVGFTGDEMDKRTPAWAESMREEANDAEMVEGGAPIEAESPQQERNFSVETEGPIGGEERAA